MAKKVTDTRFNKISLLISALAFVISAGSFYFSYYIYGQSNKENIYVMATPDGADYKTNIDSTLGVLTTQWVVLIANNGDKTSSIIHYDLMRAVIKNQQLWYSGIDQRIFDENNQPVSTPIDIESGKTKKIILKVGLMLNKKALTILKSIRFKNGNATIKTLSDSLYAHKIDLFGNRVDAIFLNGKLQVAKWRGTQKQDIYYLSISTAKGGHFYQGLRWYPF